MHALPIMISQGLYWQKAHRISKAKWIDAYFDLYRQTINDAEAEDAIMEDAQKRITLIQGLRKEELK